MVVGKEKGPLFEKVGVPIFSPDSQQVAYWATQDSMEFIVIGNQPQKEFDGAGTPVWSPDNKTVAYPARSSGRGILILGEKTIRFFKKGDLFDEVGSPVFNADGSLYAYPQREGKKWYMVFGKERSFNYDWIWPGVFHPNGKSVAFGAFDRVYLKWRVLRQKAKR
jgi:hypothetical protein